MIDHTQLKALIERSEQQSTALVAQRNALAAMVQRIEQERDHLAAFKTACMDQIAAFERMCDNLQHAVLETIATIDAMIDRPDENEPKLRAVE